MKIKEVHIWQDECIRKYGFYVHAVGADEFNRANYHTHGLYESFQHPDLQIVISIDPNIAHDIFLSLAERIKKGEIFSPDVLYMKVIKNGAVKFVQATEGDADSPRRKVLRVIFPDPQGNIDKEKVSGIYRDQYEN